MEDPEVARAIRSRGDGEVGVVVISLAVFVGSEGSIHYTATPPFILEESRSSIGRTSRDEARERCVEGAERLGGRG